MSAALDRGTRVRTLWLVPLVVAFGAGSARADDPDPIVVRVGSASLRASDVARRMARLPAYQMETLGGGRGEVRRAVVDAILVPELLYSEEAERLGLRRGPAAAARIRDALSRALVDVIRTETRANKIPDAESRAYYDSHASEYVQPERLRLSRILVDDADLARRILSQVRGPDAARRWSELAREHSLDTATKMRGGTLGFVHPDGRTDVPQLAVDPALFVAASKVKDGELVPDPVHEGSHLAVIWRRGSLAPVARSFDSERSRIEEILVRQRVDKAVGALVSDLKSRELRNFDPRPLDTWKPTTPAPALAKSGARSQLSRSSASPAPERTERGLR